MSLKKVHDNQPKEFKFTDGNLKKAEEILKRYPEKNKKSAVMPFLYLAQKQNSNWIPLAAMKYIAKFLSMPYISVYEVATFYSMYNLAPVGKHFIQVCTTTPCLIRGADKIVKLCKEKISLNENEISQLDRTIIQKLSLREIYSLNQDLRTIEEGACGEFLNNYFEK